MALSMSIVVTLMSIHGFNNEYSKVLNLMFLIDGMEKNQKES